MPKPIVGRFAPSPTGALHLGSLTTAIASYCHIKSMGGRWLLRMEDTDTQRCLPEYSAQILLDLQRLGLYWDGDIWHQSQRTDIYNAFLSAKLMPRLYGCTCSRKQLQGTDIYPRFCLPAPVPVTTLPSSSITSSIIHKPTSATFTDNVLPAAASSAALPSNTPLSNTSSLSSTSLSSTLKSMRSEHTVSVPPAKISGYTQRNTDQWLDKKIRLQLPDVYTGFLDGLQGMQWTNPQRDLGDVVLRRSDGTVNYFLAVSVDDGMQGVTHVMRGLDILPLTGAQIAIMQYLGLPAVAQWSHLPLVKNAQGQKLSKQNLATPIDTSSVSHCQDLIEHALSLLGQRSVKRNTPEKMLAQAVMQWQNTPLLHQQSISNF